MGAEITSVYGGRATITFHSGAGAHYYTIAVPALGITELYQPGVTTIIGKLDKSGALIPWAIDCFFKRATKLIGLLRPPVDPEVVTSLLADAKNSWRDVRDESGVIGTAVHNALECVLLSRAGLCPSPTLPLTSLESKMASSMVERANNAISAGLRFFDEHELEIIQSEAPRWSAMHGYVGTGDLIAKYDGKRVVLDYKTGKRLYPSIWMQTAAYQRAFEEEYGVILDGRVGVNVGKDGHLEVKERDNLTCNADFQAFLALLTIWRWDTENTDFRPKPAPAIVGNLDLALAKN